MTWGNGTGGVSGVVSAANSLIGTTTDDRVGGSGVTALSNGNYVVASPLWDNEAGAVTWGDGSSGVIGVVSAVNSLIGTTTSNRVGGSGVTALSNGNYVVNSPFWDNGATSDVGAVTWGDGSSGVSGVVSAANSLIGTTVSDRVGDSGVTALSNGNYVVRSPIWDNGAAASDVGAVTWGDGSSGVSGVVSAVNSLIGTTTSDRVGDSGVTALSNGNYVVTSTDWDNGAAASDAGAVTLGVAAGGVSGTVSSSNSVIGTRIRDDARRPIDVE